MRSRCAGPHDGYGLFFHMKSILALFIGMLGALQSAQFTQNEPPDTRQIVKNGLRFRICSTSREQAMDGDAYAHQKVL
jgi:hypothetical protein